MQIFFKKLKNKKIHIFFLAYNNKSFIERMLKLMPCSDDKKQDILIKIIIVIITIIIIFMNSTYVY